jgi:phage terminase small subunit
MRSAPSAVHAHGKSIHTRNAFLKEKPAILIMATISKNMIIIAHNNIGRNDGAHMRRALAERPKKRPNLWTKSPPNAILC